MPSAWEVVSAACGVAYFALWSFSFYPQVILNWKRKSAVGLSPDFTFINPIGFLALTLWSWGAFFSPVARREYAHRHDSHYPQVSAADLAFSLHALILSLVTLGQVMWFSYKHKKAIGEPMLDREMAPLLPAVKPGPALYKPSLATQVAIAAIFALGFGYGSAVWIGRVQFLDWLYYVSGVKLVVSLIKYIPQIYLNWQLKSVEGFAIAAILADFGGGLLSLAQLVVSAVFIDHQPAGIVANPAKLGLALLSLVFDVIMLTQKFVLYAGNKIQLPDSEDASGVQADS